MASPNFDSLSVKLSQKMNDAVAAAATDGDRFTSVKRTEFLNNGIRAWMEAKVKAKEWEPLREYINVESKALVANVLTLSTSGGWTGGVLGIISALDTTPTPDVVINELPQEMYDFATVGLNKYYVGSATQPYFVLDGGNFRLIGGGATDTVQLRYVKQHTDLSAGGSTDITVPPQYWNEILDEAYKIFCNEDPDNLNTARLMVGK